MKATTFITLLLTGFLPAAPSPQVGACLPFITFVLRPCIPDAPAGGGTGATLSLFVNDRFSETIRLSLRHNWTYGEPGRNGRSDTPGRSAIRITGKSGQKITFKENSIANPGENGIVIQEGCKGSAVLIQNLITGLPEDGKAIANAAPSEAYQLILTKQNP